MESIHICHSDYLNSERAKIGLFKLFIQFIREINGMVSRSGLTMYDLGVSISKSDIASDSYIIEIKLRM